MITYDLVAPAKLTGFARGIPSPANYTLNTWLPDDEIADIEAEFDNIIRTNRAAKFRAFDAETPVGSRPNLERKKVALPPLGQKTPVLEEERLKLERARSGGDTSNGSYSPGTSAWLAVGFPDRCERMLMGQPVFVGW